MSNKNKTEVIVVGAGPAGVSAAITLARSGKEVLLVERGDFAGDKNVFGGTIYTEQTAEIFPEFWKTAPIERAVSSQKIFMLTDNSSVQFEYKYEGEANAYTVYRSKWDKWCVLQAQKEGAFFAPKTLVKELILDNGKVVGIDTGMEKFYSDIVIIADGVNSLLAKQLGLRNKIKDKDVSLSIKEVIKLPKEKIEDRFLINENTGAGCKILGGPLKDMMALGFMYTNKDTISLGFSAGIDDLKKHKIIPYELLEQLKNHPSILPYIKNGVTVEYSSHLIPEGGFNSIPKIYDNRVMIAGDAAMLVNNVHFEGTNLAMLSGRLAAETAIDALNRQDFSASVLSDYYKKLQNSIVMKDLETHKNTIDVLRKNIHALTSLYPEFACEFFDILTSADSIPKKVKYNNFMKKFIKQKGISSSFPLLVYVLEKCIKK